jgi:L-ascorbate metabolism protein UlaG (beta-lactamase superfamily)
MTTVFKKGEGEMKIKYLGHSAFLITSESGARIVMDPYESGGYDGAIGYGKIEGPADIVCLSHDHADHAYVDDLTGTPQEVLGSGSRTVKDINITGVATYHDDEGGVERGDNTVFKIEVDGINICHVGDLGHDLNERQVAEIGEVDLLLTPVGGMFTIDAEGAGRLCATLEPKALIPMHFKTPKCGFPLAEVDDFLKDKEGVDRTGSSELEFRADSLPEPTKIMVMDPAL